MDNTKWTCCLFLGGEEGRLQVREPDWEASRIGVYYVRFQIITTIIRKKKKNIKK